MKGGTMKRVLILGSGGRLGAALEREWKRAGLEVVGWDRRAFSLDDPSRLGARLEEARFDVLVNCAALTNVDYCEEHRDEAMRVNAEAPGVIARFCEARGARCVHLSTDYVFDGNGNRPYTEEMEPHPVSVYGESKRAGEIAVLAAGDSHWVVRISWVFGPDRPSFVDGVVAKAFREERVEAVSNKWASPTYTVDAAALLRPLVGSGSVAGGGVVHLSNAGACSWQEYGQWALDCAWEAGLSLRTRTVGPLAMEDLKAFVAKRPAYSVLDCGKLERLGGEAPRSWKEAVREYVLQVVVPTLKGS
jgi:dTDP-4-dehydrorhamnose reductase